VAPALDLDSPILLARLRRAREDCGLSQEEAAQHLDISRTTLVAIEAGERMLRPNELVSLADLYGEPLESLMRRSTPPRRLAAQFRTAAGKQPEHVELQFAAAELQRLSEDYFELERITSTSLPARYPPPQDILSEGERGAEWLAESERRRLSLGDGPLPHLREVFENDVGLRIFAIKLPSRVGGLFAFDEILAACVAMNASQRLERQRWSLAHEYAHFLTRRDRPEITIVLSEYQRVPAAERFADSFARNFLLPSNGVRRRWESAVADSGGATAGLLLQHADWWGVSFQAFVMRLEGLRLIRPGTYQSFSSRGFAVDEGREMLQLPPREADSRLLPRRYSLLAVTAFAEGLISEERLARFLREDRLAARAAVAEISGAPPTEL
jgi:Zn-dependent peptidase ImmA (M78 family)/DNA-binding XRE family transcriptional regulator